MLPTDFVFSQNNLQDFVDCPRRFQLKYLLHTSWPAPISEPVEEQEQLIQLGSRFHRMVQQYQLGIPEEKISRWVDDPDLIAWWNAFLTHPPEKLPNRRLAESYLSMPFEGYRLAAKFDLLAMSEKGQLVIVDWKTSQKTPRPDFLHKRVQSIVYPFLIMNTGCALNEYQPVDPLNVQMIYWFPAFPEKSITLTFDQSWKETTRRQLSQLVQEISQMQSEIFPLTSNIEKCKFCHFRSLCERGISAGKVDENDEEIESDDIALDFNFDDISGIAF
jgi:hypothetical protein